MEESVRESIIASTGFCTLNTLLNLEYSLFEKPVLGLDNATGKSPSDSPEREEYVNSFALSDERSALNFFTSVKVPSLSSLYSHDGEMMNELFIFATMPSAF